jgi:hypothetical protein
MKKGIVLILTTLINLALNAQSSWPKIYKPTTGLIYMDLQY